MTLPWLLSSGHPVPPLAILVLALAIDGALGDPNRLYRVIPHPVMLIGWLVSRGDRLLNRPGVSSLALVLRGGLLTASIVLLTAAIGGAVSWAARMAPGGWLAEAILASTLIAFRSLYDHVAAVAAGLESGLSEGRAAVAHIVGRDPQSLDEAGIARAAIESAAENFSDGVVAPVFWFALLGLPGLAAYKAINTLDSMIGHRSERYAQFGTVAARLDDVVNWLPARLAGIIIALGALAIRGASAARAAATMRRDARLHRSPNAGWPEAAMAGALGFALAGPRRYGDQIVDDHWMGDGRRNLNAGDIRVALRLYIASGAALTAPFACWLALLILLRP